MECEVCSRNPEHLLEGYCPLCYAAREYSVQQFEEAQARVSKYELERLEGLEQGEEP